MLVNAPDADVTLVLQDADITCSDSSALYIYKAASVLVYLPDGTASTLTDDSSYDYSDGVSSAADEEPNACLYAKSDLIIAGGGTLTVTASGNGITGKDTLKIEDTAVSVTAANHGINGKDRLVLKQADVTVTSGGDALRATNDSDTALGCVLIGASALTLTAGEDGIQAETTLTLFDTTGTVTSGGGSGAALSGDVSAKGIKAGTDITVRSGSYTLRLRRRCRARKRQCDRLRRHVHRHDRRRRRARGQRRHDHGRDDRHPEMLRRHRGADDRHLRRHDRHCLKRRRLNAAAARIRAASAAAAGTASAAAPTAASRSPAAHCASTRAATASTPTAL